jgi:hypothetical protein
MRNEDYDRELLVFVTLFCVVFAAAVSALDTSPSTAKSTSTATRIEQPALAPVRVIGTPFVPNTDPRVR